MMYHIAVQANTQTLSIKSYNKTYLHARGVVVVVIVVVVVVVVLLGVGVGVGTRTNTYEHILIRIF